jgi:hypothetical protein
VRSSRSEAAVLALALAVPLVAAALKAVPPISDAALFEYYGRAMAHGAKLYADLWDNKLPGIYLLNAALQLAFGSNYRLHALAEGCLDVASVALFAALLRRAGAAAWAWAALGLALLLGVLPVSLDSVENAALPLLLLAYLLFFAARTAAAAVVLGLATAVWLPAVLLLVPLLDRAESARERVRLGAWYAGTVALLALALLASAGAPATAELVRSWTPYVAGSYARHRGAAETLKAAFFGIVASGAGIVVALLLGFVRAPRDRTERFALVWAACALVCAVAPGNFFEHYFLPALPACIFAAAVFARRDAVRWRALAGAVLALFFAYRSAAWELRAAPLMRADAAERLTIGARVRALAGDGAVIDTEPYEPGIVLASNGAGEDRFGMVPRALRPPVRPQRREPAVLVTMPHTGDADALVASEAGRPCARVGRWTIYLTRGAGAAALARCAGFSAGS